MFRSCLAIVLAVTVAASLPAADHPLAAFPAETGVVMRIGSPASLSTKSRAFLNKAAPQYALLAEQLAPAVGSLMGNPRLAGTDAKSDWYVGVVPNEAQPPAVFFAVRAADADALQRDVGQGYTFVRHEDWVVYSRDAGVMASVQSCLDEKADTLASAIGEPHADLFREGDFAMYFHVPVLRTVYRSRIEAERTRLLDAIGNRPAGDAPDPRDRVADLVMTLLDDLVAVAGHVAIGDEALDFRGTATVAAETASAKHLASLKPAGQPLLKKLPQGQAVYFLLAGSVIDVLHAVQPADGSGAPLHPLLSSFRYDGVGFAADGGWKASSSRIVLVDVDEPDQLRTALRTALESENAKGLGIETRIQPAAETIDGVAVDAVTVTRKPGDEVANAGALRALLSGSDATQRIAVVDGLYVHTGGEGAMARAISAIREPAETDAANRKAVEAAQHALGAEHVALLLADVPALLRSLLQSTSGQLPIEIDPAAFDALKLTPSMTGVTVEVTGRSAAVHGVLPAEQVRGLVDLFQVLQRSAPRRGGAE